MVGVSTGDYSLDNAHAIARSDVDFVRFEMEHGPLDISQIYMFVNAMVDRASILKKGNGQISVAPISRFPPYGQESSLAVTKQGLDAGLMGVAFNGVDNKEQTLAAVRGMRYPQRRGAALMEPAVDCEELVPETHNGSGVSAGKNTSGTPISGPSTRTAISWRSL